MSRHWPTPYQVRDLGFICPYCGSGIGEWCTTPSGSWSQYLHSGRFYIATGRVEVAGTDKPRDEAAALKIQRAGGAS